MNEEKKNLYKKEMTEEELDKIAGGNIYTHFHIQAYYYSAYIDFIKWDPDVSDLVNGEVAATSDLGLKVGDCIDNMNRLKVKKIIDVNSAPKGSGIYTRAKQAYRLNEKIDMIIERRIK